MVKESEEALHDTINAFTFGDEADKLALCVALGNLHPDAVGIAGVAVLEAAIEAESRNEKGRKAKVAELLHDIMRVDEYLRRMDDLIREVEANIAAMIARRDELRRLSQDAFECVFEADRLNDAILDGISEQERVELVALLGPEARNASADELRVLLDEEKKRSQSEGNRLSAEADDVAKSIDAEKGHLNTIKSLREEYTSASPERRAQIEDELDRLHPPEELPANIEREVETAPEFTVAFP